jgi:hypothetical protein
MLAPYLTPKAKQGLGSIDTKGQGIIAQKKSTCLVNAVAQNSDIAQRMIACVNTTYGHLDSTRPEGDGVEVGAVDPHSGGIDPDELRFGVFQHPLRLLPAKRFRPALRQRHALGSTS